MLVRYPKTKYSCMWISVLYRLRIWFHKKFAGFMKIATQSNFGRINGHTIISYVHNFLISMRKAWLSARIAASQGRWHSGSCV